MSTIKAAFKLFLFFLICIPVVPAQLLLLLVHRGRYSYVIPHLWHKGVSRIFSISVRVKGTPYTDSQTIYLSNHLSYLDIPVIGGVLKASFVAKADVANWPVFGFLSKLQQTAFISRSRKDASKEKNALANMMKEGKSLIIFPEGTSTDGKTVRNFKSSLFSIALGNENKDLKVQPFTISMSAIEGRSVDTQEDRDLYAWHVEMDTPLPDHLWRFAKSKGAVITLTFHDTLLAADYDDRKKLSQTCHESVLGGLQNAEPQPNIAA